VNISKFSWSAKKKRWKDKGIFKENKDRKKSRGETEMGLRK
jgi:hypothetical protein